MAESAGPPPRESALGDLLAPRRLGADKGPPGVTLSEQPALAIWQLAAWRAADVAPLRAAIAERLAVSLPEGTLAVRGREALAFHVAPRRWWLVSNDTGGGWRFAELALVVAGRAALTDLGHARTVVRLGGRACRSVLAKLCRIDLHPMALPAGHVAQTALGQVATLIHALDAVPAFDLYLPRSLARSGVGSLIDAALEFGLEIARPGDRPGRGT
jgi:sarcosine oxidase subunit gamma